MSHFIRSFRNRDFTLFWFAQLVSQFGDRINQMALIGLVAERTVAGSADTASGLAKVIAFTILPVFVVGPIAGVFVDRWPRRKTMYLTDLARGLLVLSIAFVFMHQGSMWPIYGVVFLMFCLSRFHVLAKLSLIPDIVQPDNLHTANSLAHVTGMIAAVAGMLVGGILVDTMGARGGFLIDGVTFLIATMMVLMISSSVKVKSTGAAVTSAVEQKNPLPHPETVKEVFLEIRDGLLYVWQEKSIRFIVYILLILSMSVGAIYITMIVFIQDAFNSVTKDLAFLAVGFATGLFGGLLAYGKFGSKQSNIATIFQSLTAGGLMVIVFVLGVRMTDSQTVGLGLAALLGLVVGPIAGAANTIVHQVSNDTMRGKVFGAMEIVMHFGFMVMMLLTAQLTKVVDQSWILLGVGGVFMAVGVFGFIRSRYKHSSLREVP